MRSDKGKENVLITNFMIANQGPERGSLICGKSTHNQRIKRLWRDVYNCVTRIYHELTTLWRVKKFLTPSMSLIWQHFIMCFGLLLMTSLMPGERYGPNTVCEHLWVSGQMNSIPDGDLGPEQLMHYGVERVVGGDDHEIADNDGPIFLFIC